MGERFLSTGEVAEALGVSEATVRKWIREGRLKAVLVSSRWRIPLSSLTGLLDGERRQEPGTAQGGDSSLESRLVALEGEVEVLREMLLKLEERVAALEKGGASGGGRRGRRTASEILREQGFAVEWALKLRNPDAFFSSLAREGFLVLETQHGRVAVDPQLWDQLSKALRDSGAKPQLGDPRLEKLFKALSAAGAVLYDEAKGWILPQPR